jgi:flagellar protein FliO/FliZ
MLLGLGLVLALIYVLYRVLRKTQGKKQPTIRGDDWMSIIASTPLAPSRSLHLIRVGEEIVLVGSAEQGVTPLRVYSADEARELRIEPREPLAARAEAEDGPRPGFVAALVESLRRMTAR